jgi:hypothetical protein
LIIYFRVPPVKTEARTDFARESQGYKKFRKGSFLVLSNKYFFLRSDISRPRAAGNVLPGNAPSFLSACI